MISPHQSKYLSALLDGQLTGLRRWRVTRHLRACPVCAVEYRKQQHVRRLLAANLPTATLDDSREFFWSKVKAEIERRGDEMVPAPLPRLSLGDWLSQHQPALATVAALLMVALGGLWTLQLRRPGHVAVAPPLAEVQPVSTSVPDAVATAFQSEEADVTVIWVSGLPWTPDMTEMKTLYASLDT
jgi:anti-sigma factor RsiW